MDSNGTGIGRIDCYEDMFKEITRKLYGDDTDQRSTSVQNEFETVTFIKTEDESENGTDCNDDGNWVIEEEPLKGTDGSRVAAYHIGKSTWRCYECCELITGLPREVAEHFMELHSPDSRNRLHSRKDYMQDELKLDDVLAYLERVRERAERIAPPLRRTQETQTVPATLLPVATSYLLQEIPSVTQQQQIQNPTSMAPANAVQTVSKRYTCSVCSYCTDRRDLFTRHENIHRVEKPFQCFACHKPFNRADHVKKHFLRMHRELQYDITRIRRTESSSSSTQRNLQQTAATTNGNVGQQNLYPAGYNNNTRVQVQPAPSSSTVVYEQPNITTAGQTQAETTRKISNGSSGKSTGKGTKSQQEKRYTCDFCSWSGLDNWCLKRHLNTHLKPYACSLCEYKAARSERLNTHVQKVHNKRQCSRCPFLADDIAQLQAHQMHVHRISGATSSTVASTPVAAPSPPIQTNRLQQPLHPMGGRPPPGPPVFPAPTAIAQTSSLPNNPMLSELMAFAEALRQVSQRHDLSRFGNVNGIIRSFVGNMVQNQSGYVSENSASSESSHNKRTSEPAELKMEDERLNRNWEPINLAISDVNNADRRNYEAARSKSRKQKRPRKAVSSSEDEELVYDDVAAVRTTASVVVQPMNNEVKQYCQESENTKSVEQK